MIIKNLYVRFYKSFNFDYLRKYHREAGHNPWDLVDGLIFPYVKVPIEKAVTAIVGANESGKSHLLSAIHKGLSGEGIQVEDMCRYSQFQTVETGKRKVPYFGFEFSDLSEEEKIVIASLFGKETSEVSTFFFFRNQDATDLYLPAEGAEEMPFLTLESADQVKVNALLPSFFEIRSEIALPSRVPILSLISEYENAYGDLSSDRSVRAAASDLLAALSSNFQYFESSATVQTNSEPITQLITPLTNRLRVAVSSEAAELRREEVRLARDLICKIAQVDPKALQELYDSIKDGKDGHVAGLIARINERLDAALNFPNWWVQDKQFRLVVSAREVDLAFTILDRTGTEYSFSERSQGLKYFLSYYVQYLSHEPVESGREVLTMDEPDAFLSSQAQQDLLKIFEAFSNPKDPDKKPVQVVYVTHSPFLVDKNHSERIRVLEKGASDEGTRIVKDAGKNHYEPLRSAFGAFVGETVFIGNTNIFVEGMSDQIILAGAAKLNLRLLSEPDESLDLNTITLVPAGGASHVPYMVYLARGRDSEKPPVVALLDGDEAGNEAKRSLLKGGVRKKLVLSEKYILQLNDLSEIDLSGLATGNLTDMEDLIPLPICAEAAKVYLHTFCDLADSVTSKVTPEFIQAHVKSDKNLFYAIEKSVATLPGKPRIEKVGFARTLIDLLNILDPLHLPVSLKPSVELFSKNMGILFTKLNTVRRAAEREFTQERISTKFKRLKDGFLRDYPQATSRQMAFNLFEGIEASLDDTVESDIVRTAMNSAMKDFSIRTERHELITNYDEFKNRLEQISYASKNEDQVASV